MSECLCVSVWRLKVSFSTKGGPLVQRKGNVCTIICKSGYPKLKLTMMYMAKR